MNMTSLKKQQSDIDRRSPVSDNDSESDDSSAMDQCLPFFFCSYLSASVASSRVTSPVKPMKILSDKESHGSPGSDVGPLLINDNNLSPSRKLAKNDVNDQHQNQNEVRVVFIYWSLHVRIITMMFVNFVDIGCALATTERFELAY